MYENQTEEVIRQRMLDRISDDIDKREGSVAYDMIAPKAAELAMAYMELDNAINLGFASTTYGEFLDRKAAEVGVVRSGATKATGLIILSGPTNGVVIPTGTTVYTESNIRFLTDYSVTITNGTASVNVTAEEGGLAGNVPANSITFTEVDSVIANNPNPTVGGSNIQTDESLLEEYLTRVRKPVVSGNDQHYRQWAKEVSGIGDAKVISLWNGNGTVKVILVGTDKKPVSAPKVTEVNNYINSQRPVGATVTTQSAVAKTITVSATLTLGPTYTLGIVTPTIVAQIEQYFRDASFNDLDIKYTKIGTIILGVEGVLDYANLKINNLTTNILLGENETPVLGTVTLT